MLKKITAAYIYIYIYIYMQQSFSLYIYIFMYVLFTQFFTSDNADGLSLEFE